MSLILSRLQDVKDEFDDFQEGSRELEAELEAQLEQYEKRVKELVSVRSSLEDENETLKVFIYIIIITIKTITNNVFTFIFDKIFFKHLLKFILSILLCHNVLVESFHYYITLRFSFRSCSFFYFFEFCFNRKHCVSNFHLCLFFSITQLKTFIAPCFTINIMLTGNCA